MGAILGGTMRSPLTGILFAAEVTHDFNALLPLIDRGRRRARRSPCSLLKRSILTEKVARRGYHVTREYAIDPLEVLFVRDVITLDSEPLPPAATHQPGSRRASRAPR